MRRTAALLVFAVAVVGTWASPASGTSSPNRLVCDLAGTATISQDFHFVGPHSSFYTWRWTVDAAGTCTEPNGLAEHSLWFHAEAAAPAPSLGPHPNGCNEVEPTDETGLTFGGYGALDGRPSLSTNGFRMTWGPSAGVSSFAPITVGGDFPLPSGYIEGYSGAGIEANRIFLQCPTSYPHTSNVHLLFALEQVY